MTRLPAPFEQQLAVGLEALARQATASPDAADRIAAGLGDEPSPLGASAGTSGARPEEPELATARLGRPRVRPRALVPAAAAALLAVVIAAGVSRGRSGSGADVVAGPPASTPATVNGVAYLSAQHLYVSDATGTLSAPVTGSTTASRPALASPEWSPDGRYLAYRAGPIGTPGEQVHVMLANGTHDRVVFRGPVYAIDWSSGGDLLAARPLSGGLVVANPSGSTRAVVPASTLVFSFAWSSRGTSLAYTVAHQAPQADEVRIVDATTGVNARVAVGPGPDVGILLAKWWPDDRGLLWWIDPFHSASIEADGLMLQSVPLANGRPVDLVTTSVYLPWLTWSPDGVTLAVVTGAGRLPWDAKQLALCQPREGTCTRVVQPPGTVTLDPSWTSDGSRIVFVRAASLGSVAPGAQLRSWYQSRRLWMSAPDGSAAVEIAGAGPGVTAPVWLEPGMIGFSTADAVKVISPSGGAAITIVGGLSGGAGAGPDAFGKTPWAGVALWRP